jgi:hypothetical protein
MLSSKKRKYIEIYMYFFRREKVSKVTLIMMIFFNDEFLQL